VIKTIVEASNYVARYAAATAEAWARSKGTTDAEIRIARGCVKPQLTALLGHVADYTDQEHRRALPVLSSAKSREPDRIAAERGRRRP